MGCCAIRSSIQAKTSIQTVTIAKDLSAQRQELISIIFSLHKIILSCNSQIETYLINHQKSWVCILKAKKFCIQEKLKELQVFVSKMDFCLEDSKYFKSEKKEIKTIFEQICLEIQTMPIFDNDVCVDRKDQEFLHRLNKCFSLFDVDIHQFEAETDIEMKNLNHQVFQDGTIRRKYVKSRKSV